VRYTVFLHSFSESSETLRVKLTSQRVNLILSEFFRYFREISQTFASPLSITVLRVFPLISEKVKRGFSILISESLISFPFSSMVIAGAKALGS
jgi:hypothetical protein